MNAVNDRFGRLGEDRSDALDEAVANAVDDLEILALHRPVAQIAALELIGLVRRELLDRERESWPLSWSDSTSSAVNGSEMNAVAVRPSAPMGHPETRWP